MFKKTIITLLLTVILCAAAGCAGLSPVHPPRQNTSQTPENTPGLMKVSFIDVGQGDSVLAQLPDGRNMLVDAGARDAGTKVINYLKKAGVKKIECLVATHPHEDHIGGMAAVIREFNIGEIYMPGAAHTTRAYSDLLEAAQSKGLKITAATAGIKLVDTGGFSASVLAPGSAAYEELNNYSAVIKLTCGKVSFLLTGDALAQSEAEIMAKGVNLRADVLKVSHHGSYSSTSRNFLAAVRPQYAVISAGAGNDYGYPHEAILRRLGGVRVFRTDLDGDVVFTTDGESLQISAGRI
jgi:competence protein ComEC